jgi:AraC-like DNA-binding protein
MQKSEQAYQMYMQGMTHKEIGSSLGFREEDSKHIVRNYALRHQLPFPRPSVNHKKCYDLYVNGMSLKDIALYLNIGETTAQTRIAIFCNNKNIELPYRKQSMAKAAYTLRTEKNMSYQEIANALGYENKSNCYRAIKNYKDSIC